MTKLNKFSGLKMGLRSTLMVALVIAGTAISGCRTAIVIAPPGPHCYRDSRLVCSVYHDYWGRPHRECHTEYYDRCYATQKVLGVALGPVAMGEKYGISFAAADQLLESLMDAQKGDLGNVTKLGFSLDDLQKMGDFEMPSAEGIDAVARNLDQSVDSIRNMLSDILTQNRRAADLADRLVLTNGK